MRALVIALPTMLGCLVGCGTSSEVVLTVASDLAVPEELDAVRIEVTSPDGSTEMREARASDALTLPVRLRVVHEGGPVGPIHIRVLGLLEEETLVEASAVTAFVPGESVSVWLQLSRSCRDVACEDGETCEDGECVAIEPPSDDAGAPALDAATERDAGTVEVDAFVPDAFVPDTGPPCAEGCACEQRCESGCDCRDGCGCTLSCAAGEICNAVRCEHASTECQVEARGAAFLDVQCKGGAGCTVDGTDVPEVRVECDRSSCDVTCAGSDNCRVDCKNDAACLVQCPGVSSCIASCGELDDDDDAELRACGDGLYACRRACP